MLISDSLNNTNSSHSVCCDKTKNPDFEEYLQLSKVDILYIFLYVCVFVVGVLGNILVMKWFLEPDKRNRPGSVMVITLAFNDMLASIIVPLFRIHLIVAATIRPLDAWYLGRTLCYTIRGFNLAFVLATSWILVVIATERYRWVH